MMSLCFRFNSFVISNIDDVCVKNIVSYIACFIFFIYLCKVILGYCYLYKLRYVGVCYGMMWNLVIFSISIVFSFFEI